MVVQHNPEVQRAGLRAMEPVSPAGHILGGKNAAPLAEEIVQNAAGHLHGVVEPAVAREIKGRTGRAGPGVRRSENKPPNARMHQGPHTHNTRLHGDIKHAVGQAIISRHRTGKPQGYDFSMGGRITPCYGAVIAPGNNLTVGTVTAAGAGQNVTLTTITSGDVFVGNVTATDDQITVTSAGAIEENGADGDAVVSGNRNVVSCRYCKCV